MFRLILLSSLMFLVSCAGHYQWNRSSFFLKGQEQTKTRTLVASTDSKNSDDSAAALMNMNAAGNAAMDAGNAASNAAQMAIMPPMPAGF